MNRKKIVTGVVAGAAVVVGWSGTASAHQHAIETPGGKVVTLACEPFHDTTPGSSQHSANWDDARGLHPLHWGLHKAPSEDQRAISISTEDCP